MGLRRVTNHCLNWNDFFIWLCVKLFLKHWMSNTICLVQLHRSVPLPPCQPLEMQSIKNLNVSTTYNFFYLQQIQQCLLCLSVIVSASVTLCCIFVPKLYIVLLAPHKNRKQPGVVLNSRLQKSMGGSMDSKTNNGDARLSRPMPSIGPTSHTASSGNYIT